MRITRLLMVSVSLLVLSAVTHANWGHGLGSEIKSKYIIEGQQSGWAEKSHVDAPAAKCAMSGKDGQKCGKGKCGSCPCCASCAGRYGRGLGGEYKSLNIPFGQQSGWNFVKPKATMKMEAPAPKPEAPKVVAEAPKPADTDGDGVIDDRDECPGTPAGTKVETSGCPAAVKAIEDNWVLQGVNFETNSDKIKSESFATLNEAAEILKARSKVRVQIQGHTDSMGNDDANRTLSDRRAVSVKNYLVGKGVNTNQLETIGYGESAPIADNKTAEGRAKNRRIEFKVLSR